LGQDGVFAGLKSAVEKGLSRAQLMLFMQLDQGTVVRKQVRDDKRSSWIVGKPSLTRLRRVARHSPLDVRFGRQ
jgi:hypothetical protein